VKISCRFNKTASVYGAFHPFTSLKLHIHAEFKQILKLTRMWVNAQRDGLPA